MKTHNITLFLWKSIGEDEQILNQCTKKIRTYFALSGLLFLFLFLLSVFSFHYAFNGIFDIPIFSWPLALVWSLIIFNIYRLNLSTLSADKPMYSFGYLVSLIIRMIFMILIGITLIKPLEVNVFQKLSSDELSKFRLERISQNQSKTTRYFDKEISAVQEEINRLEVQAKENRISVDQNQFIFLKNKRNTLKQEKKRILTEAENLFNASNFFFNGILIFNDKYPLVWILTIFLLILFLIPLLLKFAISPNSIYTKKRIQLQHTIILEDYNNFKVKYPRIFQGIPRETIDWEEKYDDPPFNTRKKMVMRQLGEETDFLNQIYGI